MRPAHKNPSLLDRINSFPKLLSFLITRIERFFYFIRNILWDYPDVLFFGETSVANITARLYRFLRPQSYFLFSGVIFLLTIFVVANLSSFQLLASNSYVLQEGVVMGLDENGELQRLAKINPIVTSNIQLEKDLAELIYEPLLDIKPNGEVSSVLADQIIRRQEGAEYVFELKQGVKWHDGTDFVVEDVMATLDLVAELSASPELSENANIKAISQMGWESVGGNSVAVCTLEAEELEQFRNGEISRPCTEASGLKPIISNFLELISIKIMPARFANSLNVNNISRPDADINTFPIGTGPFRFVRNTEEQLVVRRNESYHGKWPEIRQINFKLYRTEQDAVNALKAGQIHGLATVSTASIRELELYPQIKTRLSNELENQYWALYFNMRKDPDGNAIGPEFFQDRKLRTALSVAVNRKELIKRLEGIGEVAYGPINQNSEFYNSEVNWPEYNPERAIKILEDLDWMRDEDGIFAKDGQKLQFEISYVDIPDRQRTVELLVENYADIGVLATPDPRSPKEIVNEVVSPKSFDTLLYGVRTFIDPDRYELFHSESQSLSNLSSFVGKVETTIVSDQETVRVPKIDNNLENGRRLDPAEAKDKRKEEYAEFQDLLASDPPAAFLYTPKFVYYHHGQLIGVNFDEVGSIEDRFDNIAVWSII